MSLNIHKDDLLRQGSLIGEKIGFEKGIHKGAYQKALETAQTMKSMQYPIADIHKITGLSIDEINDLQSVFRADFRSAGSRLEEKRKR